MGVRDVTLKRYLPVILMIVVLNCFMCLYVYFIFILLFLSHRLLVLMLINGATTIFFWSNLL